MDTMMMDSQLARLATFTDWPSIIPAVLMAACGFFLVQAPDMVQCFSCKIKLSNWTGSESPQDRHRRESPNCQFLKNSHSKFETSFGHSNTTSPALPPNEPQRQPNSGRTIIENGSREGLPHLNTNGEQRSGEEHGRPNTEDRGHVTANTNGGYTSLQPTPTPTFSVNLLDVLAQIEGTITAYFQEYRTFDQRMQSYENPNLAWPSACPTNPGDLAAAGLFYTGTADKVQCAYCRGKLYNWGLTDSPLYQHCINFPRCAFVQKVKENRLDSIVETTNSTFSHGSQGSGSNFSRQLPAYGALLQKGYRPLDLDNAITYLLKTVKVSLQDLQADMLEDTVANLDLKNQNGGASNGATVGGRQESINGQTGSHNANSDRQNTRGQSPERLSDADTVNPAAKDGFKTNTSMQPPLMARGKEATEGHPNSTGQSTQHPGAVNVPNVHARKRTDDPRFERWREKLQSLEEENKQLVSSQMCRICKSAEANILFLPCRHLVCCDACSNQLEQDRNDFCPGCNAQVLGSVRTFRS